MVENLSIATIPESLLLDNEKQSLSSFLEQRLAIDIVHSEPIEQWTVGQGNKGIRFSNYGEESISSDRLGDCSKFVDIVSQYFNEQVYDHVSDIMIAPFKSYGKKKYYGFVVNLVKKRIFINDSLLRSYDGEVQRSGVEASGFLYTLLHEFGHLLHGFSWDEMNELLEFAEEIGWNVAGMTKEYPASKYNLGGFDASPFYREGSPSEYGKEHPSESYAETTAHILLGGLAIKSLPQTRDAWIKHAGERGSLAAPIERTSITIEHRE